MKKELMAFLWTFNLLLLIGGAAKAQEYDGTTGMIHVPTAEMAPEGEARVGVYFLNREFVSDEMRYKGEKYHTSTHFLAITPFPWVEVAYVCTLLKGGSNTGKVGYTMKDRHFSLRLRPLKEGKYWPALVVGTQDPFKTGERAGMYFQNYYVAASKHLHKNRHEVGFHLTYRYYPQEGNAKWRGPVGGVTYRPAFAPNWRVMAEYTGSDANVGIDCLLWRYCFLQASLLNGKYFSGGICLKVNLLGRKQAKRPY